MVSLKVKKMIDYFLEFLAAQPCVTVTKPNQYGVEICFNHPFFEVKSPIRISSENFYHFIQSLFNSFVLSALRTSRLKQALMNKINSSCEQTSSEIIVDLKPVEDLIDFLKSFADFLASLDAHLLRYFGEEGNPFPPTIRNVYISIRSDEQLTNFVSVILNS